MNWIKKHLYFLPVIFFLPLLGNFFSGDDWFHLRISQITTMGEFFNFFSFSANAHTASFYRPLSTQVFFFIFQKLFSLTVWPYYLFGLLFFGYSLYLVYKFSGSKMVAFIYGISVSNFTRLYFLSAFQELFLVVFSLLTLVNFKKRPYLSLLFFVLALLSKETAIVLPLLILIFNHKDLKKNTVYLTSITCVSAIYLYFRLFHFGLATGDSYLWNFSPVKVINTLMWYILWSIGAPELLLDYVGSGLKLVPKLFIDYPVWWRFIIYPLVGAVISLLVLSFKKLKQIDLNIVKYILFFLVTIAPVIFLPSHKFALELGLPLVGFSMAVVWLIPQKLSILSYCFFVFYISLNLSMNYLTYTRHYSVSRGEISKRVYNYFQTSFPKYPIGKHFFFVNDAKDYGNIWGQSRQISQAVSGSDIFKVIYNNSEARALYEDIDGKEKQNGDTISISTAQFLNQ